MNTVEELELFKKDAEERAALLTALEKLERNPSFKKLFTDGYFKDHAVQQTLALSNPSLASPEKQEAVTRSLIGIGQLHKYLQFVLVDGLDAREALKTVQTDIDSVLAEEV